MAQEYLFGQKALPQLNRRSKIETYSDILKVIGAGASKPTHVMYRANLSWVLMQGYVEGLEKQGLLVVSGENNRRVLHLTQKGFDLLGKVRSIQDELNIPQDTTYE
jgi:predicted transcriptional regulator